MRDYHKAIKKSSISADIFLKKIFTEIDVEVPSISQDELHKYPTMIVSSHRSHLDYILIGINLTKLGFSNLRFAAGDNLTNMPYVGKKFRSWGAFSVYRAMAMKRSYLIKLSNQVAEMLVDGDNIIVFPEGGRSYSGEMLDIKGGVIAAAILAQYQNPDLDIKYLPIAVSYEKLPEIRYFSRLKKGKKILSEKPNFVNKILGNFNYFGADLFAFAKFLLAPKFRQKYGKVYIDIGEPISINEITDIKANFNSTSKSPFAAHKRSLAEAGTFIKQKITELYRILPLHIVSKILLDSKDIEVKHIEKLVDGLRKQLSKENMNLKTLSNYTNSEIVSIGLEQLQYTNAVIVDNGIVKIKQKLFIEYYSAIIK